MRVVYAGDMIGYKVIGRRGVRLVPGVNDVGDDIGAALLAADYVLPIEDTHFRDAKAQEEPLDIGNIEPVDGWAEE